MSVHSHFMVLILQYFPGVRVEGILRQAADVENVERRIREYEQGMFTAIQFLSSLNLLLPVYHIYLIPCLCCGHLMFAIMCLPWKLRIIVNS